MHMITPKNLFYPEVFKLSADLNWSTTYTGISNVTVIDNFYENIDAVNKEISKLPIVKTSTDPRYFDGRKSWIMNMAGTYLPYVPMKGVKSEEYTIVNLVCEICQTHPSTFDYNLTKEVLVNCFSFGDQFDNSKYYKPHTDTHSPGGVAIVVFLNKEYNEGEGFNLYNFDTEDLSVNYFVQGKSNRAVLSSCDWLHGQHTPTDQFKNEMRYTQVIFFPSN
jgi:hypothetical protein